MKHHYCDEGCICPIHKTPLLYWPAGDEHACQDPGCVHAQGMNKSLYKLYDSIVVPPRPTTEEEFEALPRLDLNDFYTQPKEDS